MAYDPAEIQKYIEGADFPATGGELAGKAAGNGAPDAFLNRLKEFEGKHFEDANALAKAMTQGS